MSENTCKDCTEYLLCTKAGEKTCEDFMDNFFTDEEIDDMEMYMDEDEDQPLHLCNGFDKDNPHCKICLHAVLHFPNDFGDDCLTEQVCTDIGKSCKCTASGNIN